VHPTIAERVEAAAQIEIAAYLHEPRWARVEERSLMTEP
jgi:hypothetical protein